jgi:hypothetical protein
MAAYLRFTPSDYDAVARLCRPVDPGRHPPHELQRLLVGALHGSHPGLSERLARLDPGQLRLLYEHFCGWPPFPPHDPLTEPEITALAEAYGPLLRHVRSAWPLRRALVRHLLEGNPRLADKLRRLSHRQFEEVCRQLKGRLA